MLVVDDHGDSRRSLQVLLEVRGANVIGADSGLSALRMLESFRPDILLSDIAMDGMDGLELIEKIRSREQVQPLTASGGTLLAGAVTAFGSAEFRKKCLAAGYQFHIAKPLDFNELMATILSLARKPG